MTNDGVEVDIGQPALDEWSVRTSQVTSTIFHGSTKRPGHERDLFAGLCRYIEACKKRSGEWVIHHLPIKQRHRRDHGCLAAEPFVQGWCHRSLRHSSLRPGKPAANNRDTIHSAGGGGPPLRSGTTGKTTVINSATNAIINETQNTRTIACVNERLNAASTRSTLV